MIRNAAPELRIGPVLWRQAALEAIDEDLPPAVCYPASRCVGSKKLGFCPKMPFPLPGRTIIRRSIDGSGGHDRNHRTRVLEWKIRKVDRGTSNAMWRRKVLFFVDT